MNYNHAIYKYIEYIFKKSELSKRKFAKVHFIEDSTLRDILNKGDYQISLLTILRICEITRKLEQSTFSWARRVKLSFSQMANLPDPPRHVRRSTEHHGIKQASSTSATSTSRCTDASY